MGLTLLRYNFVGKKPILMMVMFALILVDSIGGQCPPYVMIFRYAGKKQSNKKGPEGPFCESIVLVGSAHPT